MPAHFENGRNLDGETSLQDFDAKEVYIHPKNRPVSFKDRPKMICFHHFQVFTRRRFQNVSVRVPFSKSIVFKIYRFQNLPAKNVQFSCEWEAYPLNFSPFSKCAGIV